MPNNALQGDTWRLLIGHVVIDQDRQCAPRVAAGRYESAPARGAYRFRLRSPRGRSVFRIALSSIAVTSAIALSPAPAATANSTADLKAAVGATRGNCPALQQDPVLDGVAARANNETQAYIEHTAKFIPFEDAMPVLRDLGFPAKKAKLLAGYGDVDAKAIHGVTVQGFLVIPDCSFTKYGVDTLKSATGKYALAAVVLAGA
jgi:hypothetical protein